MAVANHEWRSRRRVLSSPLVGFGQGDAFVAAVMHEKGSTVLYDADNKGLAVAREETLSPIVMCPEHRNRLLFGMAVFVSHHGTFREARQRLLLASSGRDDRGRSSETLANTINHTRTHRAVATSAVIKLTSSSVHDHAQIGTRTPRVRMYGQWWTARLRSIHVAFSRRPGGLHAASAVRELFCRGYCLLESRPPRSG